MGRILLRGWGTRKVPTEWERGGSEVSERRREVARRKREGEGGRDAHASRVEFVGDADSVEVLRSLC